MSDMTNAEIAVSLARTEGALGRVEATLNIMVRDVERRMTDSEDSNRARDSKLSELVASGAAQEARLLLLESRVGGAFSKYVTPTLAALAIVVSTVLTVVRL